jgi:hypothetical protein
MYPYVQRDRHYLPRNPQSVRSRSIKKQYHPPQQSQQKKGPDEESEADPRIHSSPLIKNMTSLIRVLESLLEVVIILLIAGAGLAFIAAILLALHMGGIRALESMGLLLKQKPF